MATKMHYGGGDNVIVSRKSEGIAKNQRKIQYFIHCSEERLERVKNGERLISAIND